MGDRTPWGRTPASRWVPAFRPKHVRMGTRSLIGRVTDPMAEGRDPKIAAILKMAYGFRNKDAFRTAVLFRWGDLRLHPVTHPIPG